LWRNERMSSSVPGAVTSAVEVTNMDRFGLWILAQEKEYFLPYEHYPWFRDAKVDQILNVQLLHEDHLHWPELDVDLSIESLDQPDNYPLVYKWSNLIVLAIVAPLLSQDPGQKMAVMEIDGWETPSNAGRIRCAPLLSTAKIMKKTLLIAIACGILGAGSCLGSVLTVRLQQTGGGPAFSLNDKAMPLAGVLALLKKVAQIDTNQQVFVIVDDKIPAKILVEVVSGIQETGLHTLVLIAAGEKDGKTGMYNITVDATKRGFGACVGEFDSGFMESPEYTLEEVGTNRLANKTSRPSVAPAPQVQR
jgi:hypothetical protein